MTTDGNHRNSLEINELTYDTHENSPMIPRNCPEDEETPVQGILEIISGYKEKTTFYRKLVSNKVYRDKVMTSFALIVSFMMLGWSFGQHGPALLDLQIITDTNLDEASAFFVFNALGYLIGSLISGVLYDKVTVSKTLVICLSIVGHAITLAILPWCTIYELMIFIQILAGIFGGGIDTTCNAHVMLIWGNNGKSFMQALNFALSFGGIISPFATAPFLVPQDDVTRHESLNGTTNQVIQYTFQNSTAADNYSRTSLNDSSMSSSAPVKPESRLYIAFSITAVLTLLTSIPLFFFYFRYRIKSEKKTSNDYEEKIPDDKIKSTEIPRVLKISTLACLMFLFCLYSAVFFGFNGYLTTFCVKHMRWTNFQGSAVISLFWALCAFGSFLGIFIIRFVRPVRILLLLCVLLLLSFLVFTLSSIYTVDVGIWICTALVGLGLSIFFPTVFSWTQEDMFPVNGSVSSLFLVSASAGSIISSIILGILMDNVSPMFFSYLMLCQTFLLFLNFILVLCLSRKIKSLKNMTFHLQC